MFSIGWPEIFIIVVVALMVIGPRDLPKAMAQGARYFKMARKMGRDFQRQVDDMMREADLGDTADALKTVKKFNPKAHLTKQIENTLDPDGDFKGDEFKGADPTTGLSRGGAVPSKPAAKPAEPPAAEALPQADPPPTPASVPAEVERDASSAASDAPAAVPAGDAPTPEPAPKS